MPHPFKVSFLCLALGALNLGCDSASTDLASGDTQLTRADAVPETGAAGQIGSTLAMVRRATAPFRRVEVALDAGFGEASPCVGGGRL